jgi:hypothetical protein
MHGQNTLFIIIPNHLVVRVGFEKVRMPNTIILSLYIKREQPKISVEISKSIRGK